MLPIASLLLKIVDSLIASETEPDKKHHEKIKWIYNHTHENVMIPISIVELAVFRSLHKGLNYEIEIDDRTFRLIDLYKFLDDTIFEMTKTVVDIAKKYSVDMPFSQFGSGSGQTKIEV
jgi:hypothetical protein